MKGIYEDARCMYNQGDYPGGSTEKRNRRPKQARLTKQQQEDAEQRRAEQRRQEHELWRQQQLQVAAWTRADAEKQQRIGMQQQTGIVVPLHTTPRKLDKAMSLGDVKIQAIYYLLYKYNI